MTPWAIASGDFAPLGGMDRANHALARYLAGNGRAVHLVAHRVWPDVAALPGVTVHHVRRPLGSNLLGGPLLSRQALRTAKAVGAGAHLLSNGGNTPWRGPTWIHYLHAAYVPEAANARARLAHLAGRRRHLAGEAAAIAAAPVVICNSRRTADDVRGRYRVAAEKVRVVYYGTDEVQFGAIAADERRRARADLGLDATRPLAIFIGALGDRRKGFDLLFEAWRTLSAEPSWDASLAVVGAGAEAAAWQQRAATVGMARRISFLGFRADVPVVLAAADVIVHPSRYEAYGLGVHEALCRGIPAVVSADAGVAERLDRDLAALTLPASPSVPDLVDRLRAWRASPDEWGARAQALGASLRRRSWNDMAAEITAIVEQR